MDFNSLKKGTTTNESCPLHFWSTGTGPLLLFIPGGAGYASQFFPLLTHLTPHYTAASFDRRQHHLSQPSGPFKHFNPVQQCRDIIAIAAALGFAKFSVFGNSLGGVLALQLAASYPDVLDRVIVHEAPTMALLPRDEMNDEIDYCFQVQGIRVTEGVEAAMAFFAKKLVGYEGLEVVDPIVQSGFRVQDQLMFLEFEYIVATIYCPDMLKIREAGVRVAVASGLGSGEAAYVRTGVEQARILGCERFRVPGNHTWWSFEPEEFAGHVLKIMDSLKDGKGEVEGQ
ncbi:acetyltransferase/esterase [Lophium mytilinum]|uniref:Acetyltransferase/esterase n=1 Tax=Lophium mytilinum TaxID=390894 RepID=A0A6A6QR29_9PEZI|nr:acetyltransferase/esterase [Lophium mytilinum]